jgi:folate-binding protein YgfZ
VSPVQHALLPDRGVVSVTGEDAAKLLSGLVTNETDGLASGSAMAAALLSPQGKILFDFLVARAETGYLLDVARDKAADLVKRLTMYRLRAKVDIRDMSDAHVVVATWGGKNEPATGMTFADPRHAALGERSMLPATSAPVQTMAVAAYHAHRIALGVPEGGKDYDFGDAFPHEANFDLMNGVSFEKGCYVGQEIVARMEHRGTVRKRTVRVTGSTVLPDTRPDVMMGEVVIGKLGSVAGRQGLAMLRLDRAIEALDKRTSITAGGIALVVDADMIARQRKLMADKSAP